MALALNNLQSLYAIKQRNQTISYPYPQNLWYAPPHSIYDTGPPLFNMLIFYK